jgi:hypothetical protein
MAIMTQKRKKMKQDVMEITKQLDIKKTTNM